MFSNGYIMRVLEQLLLNLLAKNHGKDIQIQPFSVLKGGGWINAVGLSNPGAETFAKMIEPNTDVPIIVSLVGSVEDDFEYMIKKFEKL